MTKFSNFRAVPTDVLREYFILKLSFSSNRYCKYILLCRYFIYHYTQNDRSSLSAPHILQHQYSHLRSSPFPHVVSCGVDDKDSDVRTSVWPLMAWCTCEILRKAGMVRFQVANGGNVVRICWTVGSGQTTRGGLPAPYIRQRG
jgi:hypothetical protein